MIKKLFIVLCLFAFTANAQTKKTKGKTKTPVPVDSTGARTQTVVIDPLEALEETLPLEVELDPNSGRRIVHKDVKRRNDSLRAGLRKSIRDKIRAEVATFWARTKYPEKGKKGPTQLCMNIVSKDTNLVYCVNDSNCVEPEVSKVLFEKQKGDSMYMLIYVDAFNKAKDDGGLCGAGHETKLLFTRWNTKTNIAKWKTKNISSCTKGITNMTKFPIKDWDKSGPLDVRYNRSLFFYEIRFDPQHPELGIQTLKDEAKEAKEKEGKKEDKSE